MRVPLDAVHAVGRTHVVVSLKTKERRVALARFRLEQACVERRFEAARQQASETASLRRALLAGHLEELTPQEIEAIALRWFERAVQRVSHASHDRLRTQFAEAGNAAAEKGLPTLNTQTVNSHLTKMATLFNWAVREEWVAKNPATACRSRKRRKRFASLSA